MIQSPEENTNDAKSQEPEESLHKNVLFSAVLVELVV